MKGRIMAILASTAILPTFAGAQTQPAQRPSPTPPAQAQVGQPGAPTAADFISRANSGNLFEIQSSQLALEKSQNNPVREFAQKMVQDHTQAGDQLKAVAQGQSLPSSPDQEHAQMLQQLRGASGPDFDRRYVQLQQTGHQETVRLFEQYAQAGDSPQLKQLAQQTLATLRQHLQGAQQLSTQLPPTQTAQAQPGQPSASGQAGADQSRIVVQQPAPTIQVDQASPQVTVQQPQPQVTVRQPQPEILVRQPQPSVTVDIPQPEIIVRMPQPDVNVAMAQPEVQVNQPQPQVQVVQPEQQPQVQVQREQPQVTVQQAQNQPQVQIQGTDNQPNVRYERAEPRVVVNQPQGQPQVRLEPLQSQQPTGQGQQPQGEPAVTQQQTAARPAAPTAAPQTTGAVPQPQSLTVSRLDRMKLYNVQGNELGDVERVVQGPDGKQYIVIGSGGFLGMGEKHVAIPVERVTMRGDRLITQGLTEDQIRSMPSFDRNDRSFRQLEGNQPVQVSATR